MRQNRLFCSSSLLLSAIAVSLGHTAPGHAEITGVTVLAAKNIGPFRGKAYREVEARMEGSAPGGAYAVPVTLAFPKEASDHNGFAVVDVVNTHTVGNEQWVLGGQPFPLARIHIGDDFLFGTGNAYVEVMWDKKTVDMLGNGTIAAPADGYTILRDAAALAGDPAALLPADAGAPPASDKVVAYGYSQTGGLLRGWYFDHLNSQGGAPTFDGALVGGAGGACYDLNKSEWKGCDGALADGGKVISLLPETDVEWGGYAERGEHPDYRVVEIAGVSHIPVSAADFRSHGMPEQNPVGFEPVVRAALVNLQEWLNGRDDPPLSVAIELSDAPPRDFDGAPIRSAARDADGNAKGGVRLPHMPSVLEDGKKAGAPLGRYTGFAWDHEKSNFYFTISGTFTPFPAEKLEALYPDHEAYVAAVAAAAEDLVAKRYILAEDAQAYIEAAKRSDIGQP
jgi:Alpha/beta hydrolase domain